MSPGDPACHPDLKSIQTIGAEIDTPRKNILLFQKAVGVFVHFAQVGSRFISPAMLDPGKRSDCVGPLRFRPGCRTIGGYHH
jgi:hypothetical protein